MLKIILLIFNENILIMETITRKSIRLRQGLIKKAVEVHRLPSPVSVGKHHVALEVNVDVSALVDLFALEETIRRRREPDIPQSAPLRHELLETLRNGRRRGRGRRRQHGRWRGRHRAGLPGGQVPHGLQCAGLHRHGSPGGDGAVHHLEGLVEEHLDLRVRQEVVDGVCRYLKNGSAQFLGTL